MKQQQTNKHSNLHREDQHITVEELWKGWKTSEGEALKPVTQDVLVLQSLLLVTDRKYCSCNRNDICHIRCSGVFISEHSTFSVYF